MKMAQCLAVLVAAICLTMFVGGCNPNIYALTGCKTGEPCPPPEDDVKVDAGKEVSSQVDAGGTDSKDAVGNDSSTDASFDSDDAGTDSNDSTTEANDGGETTEKCKYAGIVDGIWSSDQNWWPECEVKTERMKDGKCYVIFVGYDGASEDSVKMDSNFTHMYACLVNDGECGGFTRKVK